MKSERAKGHFSLFSRSVYFSERWKNVNSPWKRILIRRRSHALWYYFGHDGVESETEQGGTFFEAFSEPSDWQDPFFYLA
jgi:hypothetical protein